MSRNIRNAVNHAAVDRDYREEIRVTGEGQIKTGDELKIIRLSGRIDRYATAINIEGSPLFGEYVLTSCDMGGFLTSLIMIGESWVKEVYIIKGGES